MFKAGTPKIKGLAEENPDIIRELEQLLIGKVSMFIDYANVRPWSEKLGWHISVKRLKQFLDSFENIREVNFYSGTLEGDQLSIQLINETQEFGYKVHTKPVKLMKLWIDARGIASMTETSLLRQFISKSLLRKYSAETIEYLNQRFADMNKLGEFFIEDRKCNFDVEIGVDMLLASERNIADTFVLWSGDSDFHDPLLQLLQAGKKVLIFATARRIARELNDLRSQGLIIFDIQKIRNFICWNREISPLIAKEPPEGNSKLQNQ